MSLQKEIWIEEVRKFLDSEDTEHLHERAKKTEDIGDLKVLLSRAKKIWSGNISDADKLINEIV